MKNIPVFRGRNPLLPGAEFLHNPYLFSIGPARQFGDFFRVPFFFRKFFYITDLHAIKEVLQAGQKSYVKSVGYRNLKLALGNGLVTSEGETWRRNRRLIQPAFYKTQLEELYRTMAEVAGRYCEQLAGRIEKNDTLEISEEMMSVTADIVLKALFSAENPAAISKMYDIMVRSQQYIIDRTVAPYLIPWFYLSGRHRRFRNDMDWFDGHLYHLIDRRRTETTPKNDLLSMLLDARYEDTGEPMNDRQLRDEVITLFAAGHETSSNGLSWTLYLLSHNPTVLKKLREEVDTVLGDRIPAFDDLGRLPYTLQVVQEGMRLFPPAYAIGREPTEDVEVSGVHIPKGSVLFISIAGVHRDPRYWEQPDSFYPEHFTPENEKSRPRMAYMPFGAGPRMCIGNHFALMEMQLLLALLVRRFHFELVTNEPVVPQPLVTLKPKSGIKMRIGRRAVLSPARL